MITGSPWGLEATYAAALPQWVVPWQPEHAPTPALVALNDDLAVDLGLDPGHLRTPEGVAELVGNALPADATPVAQAYAGHQFGSFNPQLGDGRALLLGELLDRTGARRDVALKGSGPTPFSRGADGKAVLGPVLRELVMGEAMHALGVPTTRVLAAVTTGVGVYRQGVGVEPGALLVRVAASHLRIGTFQYVASRGSVDDLRALADYAIARHYPHLESLAPAERYLAFLGAVVAAQADLVAAWMSLGFIHGVMNTDNMTISGETIDYGPCAWLAGYDPRAVYSSIDTAGRYAFGNQPAIAAWNLARLAETLLPLIDADPDRAVERATEVVRGFAGRHDAAYGTRMRAKLGLVDEREGDRDLVVGLLGLLAPTDTAPGVDWTSSWRALSRSLVSADDPAAALLAARDGYAAWRVRWLARLDGVDQAEVAARMDAVNPLYVPRNHLVEDALATARVGDLGRFEALMDAVRDPYAARPGLEGYAAAASEDFERSYVTYCGT